MERPSQQNRNAEADCVIIADIDVLVRYAISDYLRSCGYTVIETSTSDETLTVLQEVKTVIDAMICDAEICGSINAFELFRLARSLQPHLQIILAGSIESSAKAAAQMCDHGPYLSRPYDPQGAADYIKRLLAKSRTKNRCHH